MKCIQLIESVYGEKIDKAFAKEIIEAVDSVVKYEKDPIVQRNLIKAIAGERSKEMTFHQKMALSELAAAYNIVDRVRDEAYKGDLKQAFLSFIEHNSSQTKGSAMNVENVRTTLDLRYRAGFTNALIENDLIDVFNDTSLAKEIYKAIYSNEDHVGTIHSEKINKIKELWRHTTDGIHAEFNANGLPVAYNKNHVSKMLHSAEKISGNKTEWKADILKLIDINKVAGEDALNMVKLGRSSDTFTTLIDKKLDAIYDKIVKENNPFVFTPDSDLLDFNAPTQSELAAMGQSAMGTRAVKGRALIFKSAEAEFEYRQKYTDNPTLGEMFDTSTKMAVRDLAFVKLFGPKPRATFMGIAEKVLGRDSSKFKEVNWAWDYATGRLFNVKSNMSDIAQGAKYLSSMAVLGNAGLSSMADFGTVTFTNAAKIESSFPVAAAKTFVKSIEAFATNAPREIGGITLRKKVSMAYRMAELMNDETTNILLGEGRLSGGRLAAASNITMAMSGLKFVNRGFMSASVKLASEALFNGNMSDVMVRGMEKSYISTADISSFKDGLKKYKLGIDQLDKIPLEHFENNSLGISAGEYRTEMVSRLYTYLVDFARSATSSPSASTSRNAYMRQRPDEWSYAALSVIMQYKGTVFKSLFNIHGAIKHKLGTEKPFQEKALASVIMLGQIAALTASVAGVVKFTKLMLEEGKDGEDIDQWYENALRKVQESPEDFMKASVQQSTVGSLFGDIFLSQRQGELIKKPQEVMLSFGYTPAAKALAAPYEVIRNFGESEKMINAVKPVIPLRNSPWTIPFNEQIKDFEDASIDFFDSML